MDTVEMIRFSEVTEIKASLLSLILSVADDPQFTKGHILTKLNEVTNRVIDLEDGFQNIFLKKTEENRLNSTLAGR
ncbi:hypothetical protein D3C87_1327860 [compost metagenome]